VEACGRTSYAFTVTTTNWAGTSSASWVSNAVVAGSCHLDVAVSRAGGSDRRPAGDLYGVGESGARRRHRRVTDAGAAISGCTAQPVSTAGLAVCATTYPAGGDYTADPAFSGSANGVHLVVDRCGGKRDRRRPVATSMQATAVSPGLPVALAAPRAWLSSMARVTDPYLINERDLATLVGCAGVMQC
jgi:hypothetical protein